MKVKATTKEAYQLLHHGAIALAQVEQNGMAVDLDYCHQTSRVLERKISRYHKRLARTTFVKKWKREFKGDFLPGSDVQLRKMVYGVYKRKPLIFTDTGYPSCNYEAMSAVDIPEVDDILEIRKLEKIKDTYLQAFIREQVDGIVHPFFNLNLLPTFRSSSDSPNFQNLPSRDKKAMNLVRGAIIPRPGFLIGGIDFSGIEVKVAACYHKDPVMIKYIEDPSTDMHRDMAIQIYKLPGFDKETGDNTLRKGTKNSFVFPEFYGSYYKQCAPNLMKWTKGVVLSNGTPIKEHLKSKGIFSPKAFEAHIKKVEDDFWNRRFMVYGQWKEEWVRRYHIRGYFDMYTGFRCSGVMSRNQAINYPVQGPGFHCLLWCIIQINHILRNNGFQSRIIGQIHDELVMELLASEFNEVLDLVRQVMIDELPKQWDWIIVPLGVEATFSPIDQPWSKKGEVIKQDGIGAVCSCGNKYLYQREKENTHFKDKEYGCPACDIWFQDDIPF